MTPGLTCAEGANDTVGAKIPLSRSEAWSDLPSFSGTVILSPHSDDAALSLGALLAADRLPRPITLVTVFGSTTFGEGGRREHVREASSLRRSEDAEFCNALDLTLEYWHFPDACVRHPELPIGELFRRAERDNDLSRALSDRLAALASDYSSSLQLAPTGTGGHMDHVLLAKAAGRSLGETRAGYADQPYALGLGHDPDRRRIVAGAILSSRTIALKREAASFYRSQPAARRLVSALGGLPAESLCEWVTVP
jgi:LmbE family N-acetylglucosaminyl deacetylase